MKKSSVAFLGLFTAFAMILSFIERQIPTFVAIPGVKLGLPNIAIIVILYKFGKKEAFIISMLRVLLTTLLFTTNGITMLYGIVGALLSFIVMVLLKNVLSLVTVSILGGVVHNIGQIVVAYFVLQTSQLMYWLPVLIISGVISGAVIGLIAALTYKKLEKVEF